MSRRKIAPVLEALFGPGCGRDGDEHLAACRAELSALVAVASVAKRVARDWDRWDEATPETCQAFHRSLARLDRASRATGEGTP